MTIAIMDGTGDGYQAAVTSNNRLKTTGVDLTLTEAATETGDTYNINTSTITLTSGDESALFYIKNNENTDLHITDVIVNITGYAGTGGQPILKILRNPLAGTVVSTATTGVQSNRNFGSSNTLTADIFEGVEGATLTGQDNTIEVFLPTTAAVTFNAFSTLTILPKGSTFGITYEPPTGTTSVDIVIAINATLNGSQL